MQARNVSDVRDDGVPLLPPSSTIAAMTSEETGLRHQILMKSTFCAFSSRTFRPRQVRVVALKVGAPGYGPLTLKLVPRGVGARREEIDGRVIAGNNVTVSSLSFFPAVRNVRHPPAQPWPANSVNLIGGG
jgi:hypothetical protein